MTDTKNYLTTKQYAEKMGLTASTVSKYLRAGKIKGEKIGQKWMIPSGDHIEANPTFDIKKTHLPIPAPHSTQTGEKNHTFTIAEFSQMTYLTEFGVEKWLKLGMLKGERDDSGCWRIYSENLNTANIKRLLRD
ncbi:MAG: helix-turn-helix domain-containing protein [Desulfobacteraceae bacterium]|nr:helix-turn-helix domain-containing protein [Desulfobacteraceae bacterium]